jgi:hypothetical protein
MSDFLAGLNTSPTVSEQPDDFSQLDVFANTDWFNVDVGESLQSGAEYNKKSSMASENLQWDRLNNSDILGSEYSILAVAFSTMWLSSCCETFCGVVGKRNVALLHNHMLLFVIPWC